MFIDAGYALYCASPVFMAKAFDPEQAALDKRLKDVLDPNGGPSAIRTRTAAKRALSFPFVPVRQLTFCHLA